MKTVGKQVLLSTIFGLLTLNVGTAESASASDIASRLKTTAREWMSALQKYKPQMTRQEKQRLITLTKRTSALIGAFLLAIGTAYAWQRWGRRKAEPAQPEPAVDEPTLAPDDETPDTPAAAPGEAPVAEEEEAFIEEPGLPTAGQPSPVPGFYAGYVPRTPTPTPKSRQELELEELERSLLGAVGLSGSDGDGD